MDSNSGPSLGINSWLEDELRQEYSHDRSSVDSTWKSVFDQNGAPSGSVVKATNGTPAPTASTAPVAAMLAPEVSLSGTDELMPLRGGPLKLAENMAQSLTMPLATSQRIIPVKVIDENRRLINHHRGLLGKSKVSFTHIIGWAIIQSAKAVPVINHAFTRNAAGESFKIVKKDINLGLAVDVAGKNGARNLVVPNIKNTESMTFGQYLAAFDGLVAKARTNKLGGPDFAGTSISLTNPGTVGTMASTPRLMVGQGAIVAVGAMDYPAEYRGVSPDVIASLGISKIMSVTCTYDHRIIQGAESGTFLGKVQSLLDGDAGFYTDIFEALHVPYAPVVWAADKVSMPSGTGITAAAEPSAEVVKEAAVIRLINAYRVRGHLMAELDPLGSEPAYNSELDPLTYGLSIWDMDRMFFTGDLAPALKGRKTAALREIVDLLRATYCGKMGVEYTYIQRMDEVNWLRESMEPRLNSWPIPKEQKVRVLGNLFEGEEFEQFLHKRFIGQKRFSLEGAETAIAILSEITNYAAEGNVHEVIIGMAHRGRLNVLANIVGKPVGQIFSEFEGNIDPSSTQGSGDVKYHLGASGVRHSATGKEIVVSLASNPSHLEAVDPVVEGVVRAKQDRLGDTTRVRVIPILIHGDAAFIGQGVVAETLNLSQLSGYATGGTLHLVINNQIGFTTLPDDSRSTPYSTDMARMIQAPIFHVNGDDPEACVRVAQLAFAYRQKFHKDVVIDMVCYRRHGHNEGDDPSYTQPLMYKAIAERRSVRKLYVEALVKRGELTVDEAESALQDFQHKLQIALDETRAHAPETVKVAKPPKPQGVLAHVETGVARATLDGIFDHLTAYPEGFTPHPKLIRQFEIRSKLYHDSNLVDWATGEALAIGSLVLEGAPVRFTGEDTRRGTFSQRHAALIDYENEENWIPLGDLPGAEGKFWIYDSLLSEYAAVGYEYGYAHINHDALVVWEAQFGDFINGAQIIIDQYIVAAEDKWGQGNGLVLLLPHGFEGQGPEHSSARIERFLQSCAEDNIQVCNATTAAQYFHLLRRQVRRQVRKPLILFTPKSALRMAQTRSTVDQLASGSFQEVLDDPTPGLDKASVKRLVFCSGKVAWDAFADRDRRAASAAIVRVEQLYPFPVEQMLATLDLYPNAMELVWLQEEPENMGAWNFVEARTWKIKERGYDLRHVSRVESGSPATGSKTIHDQELADLMEETFAGL